MKLRLAALAICLVATSAAQAAILVRVSGKGADVAGCGGATNPCRTLQFAHDQVDAGGYIVAVDPADFGGVVVTKSVNIANESDGAALIKAPLGVDMNAPGGTVRLRGMTIEAEAYGIAGRADWLDIANCLFNKSPYGIVTYAASGWADPRIILSNTRFSTGWAVNGLSRAMFANNTRMNGIVSLSGSPSAVVFKDSYIEGDRNWAANVAGVRLVETLAVLRNSVVRNLPVGLDANGSLLLLSKSTLTGNAIAIKTSSPHQPFIQSAGDNVIRGNADDTLGLITPAALH